jgi:hypothetical protein
MLPSFIGPSYNLESRPASVQRTVNMVPVPLEPGNERAGFVFRDVPGLVSAVSEWDTSAPPPPAPVAGFYGLVSSGTASYEIFNVFEPNGFPSEPLAPGAILSVYDAQRSFQAATAAGAPYTFESLSATSEGALSQNFTDATSGVTVTVSATTGNIANVTPGTIDGGGRYSVPWSPDDVPTPTPANGGSKLLVIQTNGAVVTFTFSQPMCGFGLYLTDYLDFGGTCTWRFFSGLTELNSVAIVPQDVDANTLGAAVRDASVGFLGFVSNTTAAPFDRMTMTFSATGVDRTGFDNIFVATLAGRPNLTIASGSTVQFTDTSTGSPTSWLWNFGDATTSTLQNPTKTYSTPGSYTVTLTATNAGGSDGETKTAYIVVT